MALGWVIELELHGLDHDRLMAMSFAQLWTRWRVLRGIEGRRAVQDVNTTLLGSRAKASDVTKFLKRMGADHG